MFAGCSATAKIEDARKASETFHQNMSSGNYDVIYDSATKEFKAAGTRDQLVGFLKRVNRKMGTCTETTPGGWNINATTSGTFVTLGYTRNCANGKLEEQFIWKMENGKPMLQRYNANNPTLLTD
ncbi:MAG TPA: hypothetical protein VEW69_13395 [Alphaproteobacteria bacterium]|nr:hypothetical protein [Alphaproteobacteria bacterium]